MTPLPHPPELHFVASGNDPRSCRGPAGPQGSLPVGSAYRCTLRGERGSWIGRPISRAGEQARRPDLTSRPAQRPFSGWPGGISGNLRATGSRESDDRRSPRGTGRPECDGARERRDRSSPSLRLATKRPGSLPVTARWTLFRAVPREAVSVAPPRAGFRLLRSISQRTPWGHTPCVPCGGWRGAAPPLTPRFSGPSPGPRPSASPPWPTVRPTRSWPDPPAANSVTTGEAVRIRPWASPWPTGWPGSPPGAVSSPETHSHGDSGRFGGGLAESEATESPVTHELDPRRGRSTPGFGPPAKELDIPRGG